jgi:MFS family permease
LLVWTGIANTFFPLYVKLELGISVELIGLIVSTRTMGLIIATASSGFLSDRFGRRPMILSGIILDATSLYAYTFRVPFEALMLIGIVEGIGLGMVLTTTMVLLSDIVSPRFRAGATGMHRTVMDIGGFAGPIFFMIMYGTFGSYYTFLSATIVNTANVALTMTAKTPRTSMDEEDKTQPTSSF